MFLSQWSIRMYFWFKRITVILNKSSNIIYHKLYRKVNKYGKREKKKRPRKTERNMGL